LKETTGLVGLEVDPEARTNLLAASQQVLAAVAEKIPEEAQYRANVEATMEHWIEKVLPAVKRCLYT
jgi:predicted KAP-like P-loop ATPase